MDYQVAYRGRSQVTRGREEMSVLLAPNLRRDRVSFVGSLRQPLRFREAISALHDVVVSDLRYKPRDKSAYEAYLAEQKQREQEIRRKVAQTVREQIRAQEPQLVPAGLESSFRR